MENKTLNRYKVLANTFDEAEQIFLADEISVSADGRTHDFYNNGELVGSIPRDYIWYKMNDDEA